MNPSFNHQMKSPAALIAGLGLLLSGLAAAQTFLIDATHNNGSFELLGPVPGTASGLKAKDWDTDANGDVTYWAQFPFVTVRGDSGTETNGSATNGTKKAFLQGGNATYNMTTHVIQAGDAFTYLWDVSNTPSHTVSLVYNNAGTITALGAGVTSTTAGNNKTGTYTVAIGDLAIGKKVGLKIATTGAYPSIDNVRFSFIYTSPPDTDADGLPDYYEDKYFGDNNNTATPAELALQSGATDFDGDGLSNLAEFNAGLNPAAADSDGDGLTDNSELTGTSNAFNGAPTDPLLFDSDFDGASDGEENGSLNTAFANAPTNPNSKNTDGDAVSDYDELVYRSNPNSAASVPAPSLHYLIDNNTRNGNFEKVNGIINNAKVAQWNPVAANGNKDIDNWTEWTGVSTLPLDSGVESGGTSGSIMRGYLQTGAGTIGNAAYNMTTYIAAAGNVFACSWKQVNQDGKILTFQLVYDNAGVITALPRSSAITYTTYTTVVTGVGHLVCRIPAGSPAIGKAIGVAMRAGNAPGVTTNAWIGVDEVSLNIADGDSDGDGLGDFYEDEIFGNNDGIPTPAELALQSGTSDFDGDGLNNLAEIANGTNPKLSDMDGDTLLDGAEVAGTSNSFNGLPTSPILADTDHDHTSDSEENGSLNVAFGNAPTNPNMADTDGDSISDNDELAYRSNPNDFASVPTPLLHDLINNTTRNGSFETINGGTVNTTKIVRWDLAGSDVDNWTEWTPAVGGTSGAGDNSGVEAGGTQGAMRGFFQPNNAAYNMTGYIAAAGNVYAVGWKHIGAGGGTLSARLVYNNAGTITALPTSVTTTSPGSTGHLVYRIPAGSPAIGKVIGLAMSSVAGFMQIDEVSMNIADGDSDGDGLGDFYEDQYFGNNDGSPTPAELALQTATTDFDMDGLSNGDELFLGTIPNVVDTDGDGLSDGGEFYGTSNLYDGSFTNPLVADTDGDGISDGNENGALNTAFGNAPSNPNSRYTDGDIYSDYDELIYYHTNPANSLSAPVMLPLITNNLQNGSFELLGPAPGAANVAKATSWDTDPDGDVTYWTEWPVESTAGNDSGTEQLAPVTNGVKRGFLQQNDAVYNLTSRIVQQGDVYTLTYDHITTGSLRGGLVYNDGGTVTRIVAAELTENNGNGRTIIYTVPAGSPMIGKAIGVGFKSFLGYQSIDSVKLTLQGVDSDNDGLADEWELTYFGNLTQTASGDFDHDGVTNINEQAAGTNPAINLSDTDSDGMADTWENLYFSNLGQTAAGDFDNDGTNNLTEFRLSLNPASGSSSFVATESTSGLIQWPSATGVTFRIERSSNLATGSWTTIEAAFPGTAGTASYNDPSPPAGTVFYKIGLNP